MPGRRAQLGLCCSLLLALAGCSTARLVTADATGGVVAIPKNTNSWPNYNRDQAAELMRQQCPRGYVIEREEESNRGTTQQALTDPQTKEDRLGAALQSSSPYSQQAVRTTVGDRSEWRIYFRAKEAPPEKDSSKAPGNPVAE
jgi:hypothetical protein